MASTPEPPGGRREPTASDSAADYEMGATVREGWAGTLREAVHRPSGLRVTVEELRDDLVSTPGALERLAEIGPRVAAVRDQHLLAVYDLLDDGERLQLVAEWSDRPTLTRRLRDGWPGVAEATAITSDTLAGLAALHAAGLFHGQVGPETVVVGGGDASLAELGVCAAVAPTGAGAMRDVRETASLGLRLLRGSGGQLEALRRPLDAAAAGGASAAGLREELEAAAVAVLGNGWREGFATTMAPPRRRRRALAAGIAAALLVVGAGVVASVLLAGAHGTAPAASSGPLAVGTHPTLEVRPPSSGCDTTFVFIGRGSLSGAGTLVYRWEQSDGEVTSDASLPIRSDEGSFQLTQAWRLQGSQTVNGGMTLHILEPVDRSVHASFRYVCP